MPTNRSRCGFTLVELLIVLGVLALLGAFSWPTLSRMLDRADHQRVVGDVVALIQDARQQAIQASRPHIVRVEVDRTKLTVLQLNYDEVTSDDFTNPQSLETAQAARRSRSLRALPRQVSDASASMASSRSGPSDSAHPSEGLSHLADERLPAGFVIGNPNELENDDEVSQDSRLATDGQLSEQPFQRLNRPAEAVIDRPYRSKTESSLHDLQRIVFDADGQSMDIELEVRSPSGWGIPLHLHGNSGKIDIGDRRRRQPIQPPFEAVDP